ncbi:MAG: PA14 domain-containing protein [Candidatus Omnitrophota bacterium]
MSPGARYRSDAAMRFDAAMRKKQIHRQRVAAAVLGCSRPMFQMAYSKKCYLIAGCAALAFMAAWSSDRMERGLVRTMTPFFQGRPGASATSLDRNLNFIQGELRRDCPLTRDIQAVWTGYLWLPETKTYDFTLLSDADVRILIDGREIAAKSSYRTPVLTSIPTFLSKGNHRIEIQYRDDGEASQFALYLPKRGRLKPISSTYLSPYPLSTGRVFLRRIADSAYPLFMLLTAALAPAVLLFMNWIYRSKRIRFAEMHFHGLMLLIFLAGLLLRLVLCRKSGWAMHGDEAIVGIMAQRIAAFRSFHMTYLGQDYGGPFESYLMAVLFILIGYSPVVLRMVPLFLSSLAAPALGYAAKENFGFRAGLAAALLWAIPPVMPLVYSLMTMVGPVENVIFLALAFYLWAKCSQGDKPIAGWQTGLIGFALGIGTWINLQMLYILPPLFLFLLLPINRQRNARFLSLFFAFFLIGCLPLILYNLLHPLATLYYFLNLSVNKAGFFHELSVEFLKENAPVLLGQKVRWHFGQSLALWPRPWCPKVFALIVLLAAAGSLLYWRRRKSCPAEYDRLLLLAASLTTTVVIFCFSGLPNKASRHIFLAFPLFLFLLSWFLSVLSRRWPKTACILLGFQLFWNAQGYYLTSPKDYFQPVHLVPWGEILPANFQPIADRISQKPTEALYADYWIGENIAFLQREQIPIFSNPPRRLDDVIAAEKSLAPCYVFHINSKFWPDYSAFFAALGWSEEPVLPLMLYRPQQPLPLAKFHYAYEIRPGEEFVFHVCDGNLYTAWTPKPGADSITIRFPEPLSIHRLAVIASLSPQPPELTIAAPASPDSIKPTLYPGRERNLYLYDFPAVETSSFTLRLPPNNEQEPFLLFELFCF